MANPETAPDAGVAKPETAPDAGVANPETAADDADDPRGYLATRLTDYTRFFVENHARVLEAEKDENYKDLSQLLLQRLAATNALADASTYSGERLMAKLERAEQANAALRAENAALRAENEALEKEQLEACKE